MLSCKTQLGSQHRVKKVRSVECKIKPLNYKSPSCFFARTGLKLDDFVMPERFIHSGSLDAERNENVKI